MMDSRSIRKSFLSFFEQHDHRVVASAPLVPDDQTLLFVNAGMVPFKDTFLGASTRSYSRATSCQKCMRVSGKHNDLENVGPSARHHTFFEMLGNFSFGDYFKLDAIRHGWSFMTETMGIDPDRLVLTVFQDDDEARDIWTGEVGVSPNRVLRMGEKTNLWMMADVGPFGPTTEIHYDFGPERCTCGRGDCSVALDNDCGRWLEVWNIVFMQNDRLPDGSSRPLPHKGVDTGMGFERIVAVKQGVYSNYQTDLFVPILDRVQQLLGHDERRRSEHTTGYRVLGDHGRSMSFLIADGVLPGNEGRGYVLRLIMRRAMRFGKLMGFDTPFLTEITDEVSSTMGDAYPELLDKSDWIREVVAEEESRFERTLDSGMTMLDDVITKLEGSGGHEIDGGDVFQLYDTYGFPPDLTRAVADEHGLDIDRAGFDAAMSEQRERARAGGTFESGADGGYYRRLGLPEISFAGYETTEIEAKVVALTVGGVAATTVDASLDVEVVLDRTPFYAEAGGQVGDTGSIVFGEGSVRVTDTLAPTPGVVVHRGHVESGTISVGEVVTATVDVDRRLDIMRNHTATHLLHRALQVVLGEHAQQRGSLVAPDRLRFDFAHLKALTPEEIDNIETMVNEMVREDVEVSWREEDLDDARREGAMMLFGEKYSERVRVVSVEGLSKELCGGTHLGRTGQIGQFVVTSESSVGAGLRRVEAMTGRGAEDESRRQRRLLMQASRKLKVQTDYGILPRIDELLQQNRELERLLQSQRGTAARDDARSLASLVQQVDGASVVAASIDGLDAESMRSHVDALREEMGSVVVVLGTVVDGKPRLIAAVTDDLVARGVHAGQLIKSVAGMVGGGGGGKPNLAEAGGRDAAALDGAIDAVPGLVHDLLAAK